MILWNIFKFDLAKILELPLYNNCLFTESMASALGAAGMRSGPEVDVIAQRAGQDSNLRTAYREQVRSTLRHNLNSNPDYLPDKYPNTTKYFKKQ